MKRKIENSKMYVVRKYIKATSAINAIKKDRDTPVHDVWIDDSWKDKRLADAIGFGVDREDSNDYEE